MSLETTFARADARDAEAEWQRHRKTCSWCRPAAQKRRYNGLCLEGTALLAMRNELRAEAQRQADLDRQPTPGQGVLFS